MPAAEIAGRTSIAESSVREILSRLVSAGVVGYTDSDDGEQYFLNKTTSAKITAALVDLLTPGAGDVAASASAKAEGDPLRLDVPTPPTACLACNNTGFVTGVLTDMEDLLSESKRYQLKLQALSSEVLAAQEAERKRISRELHDDTAQALTSLLVRLRLLERTAGDATVSASVEELHELTSSALENVRRLAMDLRPSALDDLGLAPALESFVERFSSRWSVRASCEVRDLKSRLPAEIELALYRVAQEALNNVAKHAVARHVDIRLAQSHGNVTLVVTDDGRGFDEEKVRGGHDRGLGLFGMSERLALVGGSVEVDTRQGKGTTVTVTVPVRGRKRKE